MLRKQILPAIFEYESKLATIIQTKKSSGITAPMEEKLLLNINSPLEIVNKHLEKLEDMIKTSHNGAKEAAEFAANEILPLMDAIRELTDTIENNVSKKDWPIPDYNDMLFGSIL